MKLILPFSIILTTLAISCADDNINPNPSETNTDIVTKNEISVCDGYLNFPTYKSLEDFLDKAREGKYPELEMSSRSGRKFESLAMLEKSISNKARSTDDEDDSDELEEMTEEEYNLMKAEELMFDDLMMHAMDTTLRICVEGIIYKIADQGTFSTSSAVSDPSEAIEAIEHAIATFDTTAIADVAPGCSVQLTEDLVWTNTFGVQAPDSFSIYDFEETSEEEENGNPSTAPYIDENKYHKEYNVKSYKWKSKSIFQKFCDFLRGKDVSRERKFTKNKKMVMKLFDVNYKFYQSAGLKVKMQKRKKFLGITYWKNTTAEKIVIGFNHMDGVMTYKNPNYFSKITPSAGAQWKTFQGSLNGISGKFIYGSFSKVKFIEDWVGDEILGWMPEIKIGDKDYTNNFINKIYDAPADKVYSFFKNFINRTVYSPIEHQIKPKDPMIAYLVWGCSEYEFNKQHPYITGEQEYGPKSCKSVIFDRSFGIMYDNGLLIPLTPTDFDIKKIDVYGAVKYNGKWLGIRFYS